MNDIRKKSFQTFAVRLMIQSSLILSGIVLARTLGPYGKGAYSYILYLMSALQALGTGQASAIAWQYGRHKLPAGSVYDIAIRIWAFTAIPAAVLLALVSRMVTGQSNLLALAVALPFAFYIQLTSGFFLADSKVRLANTQVLFTTVGLSLAVIALLTFTRLGLTAVLTIWVASHIAGTVYSFINVRPYLASRRRAPETLKPQFLFGLRIGANELVGRLNNRIDVFIILFVAGASALGIYSVAVNVGELLWQLSGPITFAAYGRISTEPRNNAAILTAKCTRYALAMVFTGSVALFFFAPFLITLVYGRPFAEAGAVVRVLLPGIIAYSGISPLYTFYNQTLGKPQIPLLIVGGSTVMCAVITLATVHFLGMLGAAFATSISYSVAFATMSVLFLRCTQVPVRDLFFIKPRVDFVRWKAFF